MTYNNQVTRGESSRSYENIYSDCRSAVEAILGGYSTSREVQGCWSALKVLDESTKWSLSWVKGHARNHGNEMVDMLAKQGVQ